MSKQLTPKQQRFVEEYLLDLNGSAAARRAGYSERTANEQAVRLLANVSVQSAIAAAMAARSERTKIDQDRIVQELWNVVTADANGLIEFRRTCCRHCYGIDHAYQWVSEREFALAMRSHQRALALAKKARTPVAARPSAPDPSGGFGFDPRRSPVADCPDCFGEGVADVFLKDTRDLSPELRSLYAGVKRTKDGIEVKMHDKQGFAQLLMRHLGMLKETVEHTGKDGGPIQYQRITRRIVDPAAPAAAPAPKERKS
ncbi:terminase small subunit [Burkholderia gladioli]|uniref:Terminase small subunit n=1 Tax=Burkholderia gladioli TaxID=28095 RepID=A0AAW3EV17_BURGA|nr:terminase small subunit [Burkholderia gladioli]AJX00547.1 terminase small subunit [Burkholderia gladioli]ASD79020.1 terminase small subunit [Burkholderia gladioli pv. gladioli]AWY55739.1 terminase small subunit [Burkholderia gladioli pv. gladioli]KGC10491.1 terminase small subunit [Burkholderia gladioli]KGC10695.1 terminase small subunit [Burkholderia gladioli]